MARRITPWKVVAVGGALLGALGGALALYSRNARAETAPQRIALIGDSYAFGLGPHLANHLTPFEFEGREGAGIADWSRLPVWLEAFQPTTVLVSLGVNDGASPNVARYQELVRALHGIGARVVWIQPPAAVHTPRTRDMISALGVPHIEATTTPLAADRLHPRDYAPWALEIARVIS